MGDGCVDAKRSRPSIGKPAMCHARKERVLLIGTDQRITSGPAARTAASRGRINGCTRIVSRKVRFFSLAPRAPSIHGTWFPNARTLLHRQLAIGDMGQLGRPSGFEP